MRSNKPPAHGDEPHYETVVMRRFHLTPGESEYVFVKRRLAVLPFKDRVEPERAKSRNEKGELRRGLLESVARKGTRAKNDGIAKPLGYGRKPVSRLTRPSAKKSDCASSSRSGSVRADLKPRVRSSSTNTRLRRKQADRRGRSVVPR